MVLCMQCDVCVVYEVLCVVCCGVCCVSYDVCSVIRVLILTGNQGKIGKVRSFFSSQGKIREFDRFKKNQGI